MHFKNCLVLAAAWLVLGATALPARQDWDDAEFEELCKSVCQAPDETWRSIPWKTDLLEAQRISVAESKPIFIWAMDGHPLGCT